MELSETFTVSHQNLQTESGTRKSNHQSIRWTTLQKHMLFQVIKTCMLFYIIKNYAVYKRELRSTFFVSAFERAEKGYRVHR